MAYPTVELQGRTIILMDEFMDHGAVAASNWTPDTFVEIREAAKRHPDAVAFGHVAGHWVPAA
jgi:hypothetical protein